MATPNKKGILEKLSEGVVLGDGGYLLELEKRGRVRAGPFTPEVALNNPESLLELHREFRDAGAEVLQALTFYASRDKLATVGMGERVEELNRAAVRIARQAAGDRCLVAGNLSLTWMYEPSDKSAADRVRKTFDEQLDVQVAEGVDFIIGETFSFLGEALLAVERAKKTKLPVMVTVCFENEDITTDGKTAAEVARALGDAGADVVGINCLRSPEHTLPLMAEMRKAVPGYIGCQPVAYRTTHTHRDFTSLPAFPDQLEPYQLTRREMAEYAVKARELGVNYIGACCGAVATHIREMARALGKLPADDRVWKKGGETPMSAYEYYGHDQKAKAGS
jgi:betaine-homocysteine S-methyltransferase